MSTKILSQPNHENILSFIMAELAPFPARYRSTLRYVLCFVFVIFCSMTFRVPFLALSLIMVFFTAHENNVMTRLSGIILLIGATITVPVCIVIMMVTIDYPMLRISVACVIAVFSMYFMRKSKFGAIGFELGISVFYAQSFVDIFPSGEMILRSLLWVWIAVAYPILVTIVVNYFFLPSDPTKLLSEEAESQINDVLKQLRARRLNTKIPKLDLNVVERGVNILHSNLQFAIRSDKMIEQNKSRYVMRESALASLHTAASELSKLPHISLSTSEIKLIEQLEQVCLDVISVVKKRELFTLKHNLNIDVTPENSINRLLADMVRAFMIFDSADIDVQTEVNTEGHEFKHDDIVYLQFGIKTVLVALLGYVFYTGTRWVGIHTVLLTSFIVSLPSLGASTHRGINRIIGCLIGSLYALFITVFITPHLESIAGIIAVAIPIAALGAWIASGSNKSNYIGVQIFFSYSLAVMGQFGPVTDLTEIRDRIIGIVLGVGLYILVSTFIWPEREGGEIFSSISSLLRKIALTVSSEKKKFDTASIASLISLSKNRELMGRVALEPGWQYAHASVHDGMTRLLSAAQHTLASVNKLQRKINNHSVTPAELIEKIDKFKLSAESELHYLADSLDGGNEKGLVSRSGLKEAMDSIRVLGENGSLDIETYFLMKRVNEDIGILWSEVAIITKW